jgi:SAM-dependent methyltransferase
MRILGNPSRVNQELINRIKQIQMHELLDEDSLRGLLIQEVTDRSVILDCGQSLRHLAKQVKEKCNLYETIDINEFDNYPDYLVDVCDTESMRVFAGKFDFVVAFSLLEHCHEPFSASANLFGSLRKGGKLFGSAPFLFPRHGPKDLSYQDFWRFSRDSYAVLFPQASKITLYPLRGRIGTALNVLSLRYRFSLETKFFRIASTINRLASTKGNELQSSGYGFIVER